MSEMAERAKSTVKERILLHLLRFSSFEGEGTAPAGISQRGIAEAIGAHRPHVSMAMSDLKKEGLVEERKLHVMGATRRMQTYSLTQQGVVQARSIKERLLASTVEYKGEEMDLPSLMESVGAERLVDLLPDIDQDGIYAAQAPVEPAAEAGALGERQGLEAGEVAPDLALVPGPDGGLAPPEHAEPIQMQLVLSKEAKAGLGAFSLGYCVLVALPIISLFHPELFEELLVGGCGLFCGGLLIGLSAVVLGLYLLRENEAVFRRTTLFISLHPLIAMGVFLHLFLNDWEPDIGQLRTSAVVLGTVTLVAILPSRIEVGKRAAVLNVLGIFLMVYSFASMALSVPGAAELLVPIAATFILVARELERHPSAGWFNLLLLGVGLGLVAISVSYLYHFGMSGAQALLAIAWAIFGTMLISLRVLTLNGIVERLREAAPLFLATVFGVLSVPFFYSGLVAEGFLEAALCAFLCWYGYPALLKDRAGSLMVVVVMVLIALTTAAVLLLL